MKTDSLIETVSGAGGSPEISIVVPVIEDGADSGVVYSKFSAVASSLGRRFEFVFVVEGRGHQDLDYLENLALAAPGEVTVVVLSRPVGESESLTAGFERARGQIIVTLAPHLQVQPAALATVFKAWEASSADMIVGRRFPRSDGWVPRLQSALFHQLVRGLTGTGFRDLSCGLRVMSREVATSLRLYGDLYRFIPVLAHRSGFAVEEVKVEHHPSDRPRGLYGPAAYTRRLLDTLTMFFLVRFTRRPLRFFGMIGIPLLFSGVVLTAYLGIYRLMRLGGISDRPLLVVGVLLVVMGIQSLSIGLLGELIIFMHGREAEEYRVAEAIVKHSAGSETVIS